MSSMDKVVFSLLSLMDGLTQQMAEPPTHIVLGADVETALSVIYASKYQPNPTGVTHFYGLPVLRGPDGCCALGWCFNESA